MQRQPDHAWDALVNVTGANPEFERGRIAIALKAIRAASADSIAAEELPLEIERRAKLYHQAWPTMTLTPTALARHWNRVVQMANGSAGAQALDIWMERYHD